MTDHQQVAPIHAELTQNEVQTVASIVGAMMAGWSDKLQSGAVNRTETLHALALDLQCVASWLQGYQAGIMAQRGREAAGG